MNPIARSASTVSLDGKSFVLSSSTLSPVNQDAPTRFDYRESEGLLWGDYSGDTVVSGHFVGARNGDRFEVWFAHRLVAADLVVTGSSVSVIECTPTGVRLVENFAVAGVDHVSVCEEIVTDR